jgi:hypothetical protein
VLVGRMNQRPATQATPNHRSLLNVRHRIITPSWLQWIQPGARPGSLVLRNRPLRGQLDNLYDETPHDEGADEGSKGLGTLRVGERSGGLDRGEDRPYPGPESDVLGGRRRTDPSRAAPAM